jgi:hypothetical protein
MSLNDFKIFQEPPIDLDETWRHGALLGGITAGAYDGLAIASAFKTAGDQLIKGVPSEVEAYEVIHPILYCYRHSIELYLKAIVRPSKKDHLLKELSELFAKQIKSRYGVELAKWVKDLILEFDEYDRKSFAFQYDDVKIKSSKTGDEGEFWVDLIRLKAIMDNLQKGFLKIASNRC